MAARRSAGRPLSCPSVAPVVRRPAAPGPAAPGPLPPGPAAPRPAVLARRPRPGASPDGLVAQVRPQRRRRSSTAGWKRLRGVRRRRRRQRQRALRGRRGPRRRRTRRRPGRPRRPCSSALTWSGVRSGRACSSSATSPETTAVACDVPLPRKKPSPIARGRELLVERRAGHAQRDHAGAGRDDVGRAVRRRARRSRRRCRRPVLGGVRGVGRADGDQERVGGRAGRGGRCRRPGCRRRRRP